MKSVLFASAADPFSEIENRYPPLWPAYLAAFAGKFLGRDKVEFRYAHGEFQRSFKSVKPDLVALSSVTRNFKRAAEYAHIAKKAGVPVIVGGMHITSVPSSLTRDMDAGCIGEGEQTFLELLRLFLETGHLQPAALARIDGLVYHEGDATATTPDRSVIASLDEIPHPDRSVTGYGYRNYISSARGCQYRCVYCSAGRYWGTVRYNSAEYVVKEVHELIENGVKVIRFSDDNFIGNHERLREIADAIMAEGLHRKVRFSCWCRASNVTPDIAKILRTMNVVSVKLGLESGSDKVLRSLKAGVTLDDNIRAVNALKDEGLQVNADFMIGAPKETMEEILQTYRFIKESRVDFVDVNLMSPLPGTPIWDYALAKGIVSADMDWANLNFKPHRVDRSTPVLSEKVGWEELGIVYRKFQRLCYFKMVKAFPNSPWRNEIIPHLWLRMRRRSARFLGFSRANG